MKNKLYSHRYLFIFFILIMAKFIFARIMLFDHLNLFGTLWVESGYLFLVLGLIELIPAKKLKLILYINADVILSIILLAVLMYHGYFGYIVTYHAFGQVGQVGAIKDSVKDLFNPIYLWLFADFLALVAAGIYNLFKKRQPSKKIRPGAVIPAGFLIVGLILVVFNLYSHKDDDIASTVAAAKSQGIITYEILAARQDTSTIMAEGDVDVDELKKKIRDIKQIDKIPESDLQFHGAAKGKNLIMIQAEAFQTFPVDLTIDGQEVTPFLNTLKKKSLYFPNIFQTVGGGNTSDAEFLFNTSVYPAPWTPTSETYPEKAIPSFPKVLSQHGYKNITFHAHDITFWNRNKLYPALGIDKYYAEEFYGQEDKIGIGPSDEVLYEKALPELVELQQNEQPFYAQFVTLTSHHPFKIPDRKDKLKLPDPMNDSIVGDYIQSMYYTDYALEGFVEDLKEKGIWKDSILVFYGDHFGLNPNNLDETDLKLLNNLVGHEYTFIDQFNIPFMVHVPNSDLAEVNETVGGQIDMMPTVANLMGVSLENLVYFGQDLINYPDNLVGSRYYTPVGSFYNNEIVFKPNEGFEDGEAFDLETREPVKDYSKFKEDYERILKLTQLSDEYMESLPER